MGDAAPSNTAVSPPSQVSPGSVFGTFLTIWLCILAQPYGSLVYRPPTSSVGTFIFFFWRFNPLSCAAEAVVILYVFLRVCTRRIAATTTSQPSFPRELHLTAAALLILRADTRDETGIRIVQRLGIEGGNQGNYFARETRQRRRRLVADVLAVNSPARPHDIFIYVVTTAAMLVVLVKLAATTLPYAIIITAWLLTSGWLTVQLLVGLANLFDIAGESEDIVECTAAASNLLNEIAVQSAHWAAPLPLFALEWHNLFRSDFIPEGLSWVAYGKSGALMALPGLGAMVAAVLGHQAVLLCFRGGSSGQRRLATHAISISVGIVAYSIAVAPLWRICTGASFPYSFHISPLYFHPLMFYTTYLWMFKAERDLEEDGLRVKWQMLNMACITTISASCFIWMMYMYDSSGTARPEWTEWLG